VRISWIDEDGNRAVMDTCCRPDLDDINPDELIAMFCGGMKEAQKGVQDEQPDDP